MNSIDKANCLLVLPRSIFPVIGGYAIKNHALIQILHQKYNLYLVVISDHNPSDEELAFYNANSCEARVFVFGKFRYLLNAFTSLFSKEPLQTGYFYFGKVQKYIDSIIDRQDITIGALIRAMKYLKRSNARVRVFDMVDSIGLNYQRSLPNVKSLLWKWIYRIETDRLLKSEQEWIKSSDITFLFNWKEAEYWSKHGNVQLVPHGVNDALFSYEKTEPAYRRGVTFLGKMDYQPNVDAVLWYLANVHSEIGDRIPFYVVGASPTEAVRREAAKYPNVVVTGFVDDPYLYVKSSLAVVAPMQTGGGIQNKVLEAMGLGKAVVTTTLSAFPIKGAENGRHLIIADTPDDFIHEINRLSENPEKAEAIGKEARNLIHEHYTWNAYGKKYIGEIDKILKRKSNDNKK